MYSETCDERYIQYICLYTHTYKYVNEHSIAQLFFVHRSFC